MWKMLSPFQVGSVINYDNRLFLSFQGTVVGTIAHLVQKLSSRLTEAKLRCKKLTEIFMSVETKEKMEVHKLEKVGLIAISCLY